MTTPLNAVSSGMGPLLPEGAWSVNPQRSEIGFAVKNFWGLQTVRGVFGAYDGRLMVGAGGAGGELTIEAGSLDTGHKKRDRHLRSADFFDVERYPRMVFTATGVAARNGALTVDGDLAVGSSRIRLEVPVTAEQAAGGELRLEGSATVSRQTAGMPWNKLGMIGGDAVLHAHLTLNRAAP
ncbi:MAG TPA: YceI family protein [Solirubrobacteraceae bacterium]|nr:YceI family protein [Solirubrobacteraceae bacterium]